MLLYYSVNSLFRYNFFLCGKAVTAININREKRTDQLRSVLQFVDKVEKLRDTDCLKTLVFRGAKPNEERSYLWR